MLRRVLYALLVFHLLQVCSANAKQELRWNVFGKLPAGIIRFEVQPLEDEVFIVIGGHEQDNVTSKCTILSLIDSSIRSGPRLLIPRAEFVSLLDKDSTIYVFGGITDINGEVTNTVEKLVKGTSQWQLVGNLIEGRRQHCGVKIDEENVLIVGGRDSFTTTLSSAEIFNLKTGKSRKIDDFPVYINNGVAAISSDNIPVVFGGRSGGDGSSQTTDVYSFNKQGETWRKVSEIPQPAESPPHIKLWEGYICITGGNNEYTNWWNSEVVLEVDHKFYSPGKMTSPRHGHFLAQWDENTIITGSGRENFTDFGKSVDFINVNTSHTRKAPPINYPRFASKAISVPSFSSSSLVKNRILVIGGVAEDYSYTPFIEILDTNSISRPTPCNKSLSLKDYIGKVFSKVVEVDAFRKHVKLNSVKNLCPGDKVLIIQMQGADIEKKSGDKYGTLTSINSSGNYEFARVNSIVDNKVVFEKQLSRTYEPSGKVQLVFVPEFKDLIVNEPLSCNAWDGDIGGVLSFSVQNDLFLNSTIDVTGKGFRGGKSSNSNYSAPLHTNDYFSIPDSTRVSRKGEGVFGWIMNEHLSGRGACANGGGGGNNHNAGGGGGSNVSCGGNGGFGWGEYGGDREETQGLGGHSLQNDLNRIFLGGGGGAGHSNENTGTDGGNGGGIVIIQANEVVSDNQSIIARGTSSKNAAFDGAGGGGAGGGVLVECRKYTNKLYIDVRGGSGGSTTEHKDGPGGGGGGGFVGFSSPDVPSGVEPIITGGGNGVNKDFSGDGASTGCPGIVTRNITVPGDLSVMSGAITENVRESGRKNLLLVNSSNILLTINELNVNNFSIYDKLGEQYELPHTVNESSVNIDISSLPNGQYFLKFENNSHTFVIIR